MDRPEFVKIGYRRLYKCNGVEISDGESIAAEASFDSMLSEVTISKKPRYGIVEFTSSPPLPDELKQLGGKVIMATQMKTKESGEVVHLEIACFRLHPVSEEEKDLLLKNDPGIAGKMWAIGKENKERITELLDVLAGTIGLKFHRQLVLEPVLIEAPLFHYREKAGSYQLYTPAVEVLEEVSMRPEANQALAAFTNAITSKTDLAKHQRLSLAWLGKAWKEKDPFSRFMSFFIPIEILLSLVSEPEDITQNKTALLDELDRVCASAGISPSENKAITRAKELISRDRPSLNSRFFLLAQHYQSPGWEGDIVAFRRFNQIRNDIIHQGEQAFSTRLRIDPVDEKAVAAELGDLAERYVSLVLFGDADVYQSRWRPKPSSSG